jgi:N-acetylneuraminate synthase
MNEACFVAEVSSNHHTDLRRCLRFVDVAAELGCSGVKFQQFRIERLFAPEALRHDPRLLERRAWELPEDFNAPIARHACERGVDFASTPFYLEAVELLEPWVAFFKVASYQILWHELLRELAHTEKHVVLATGMATLDETRAAVELLFEEGCPRLTLLHCVSSYPTPMRQANLAAIGTLREAFGTEVGWSDHSVSTEVVRRAVRVHGASLVELHLDIEGEGDEYRGGHCWLPHQVRELFRALESEEPMELQHAADGSGEKKPRSCEREERLWRSDPSDGLRPLLEVRRTLSRRAAV